MEKTTILDENINTPAFTAESLAYLRTGARWAKFISIVAFCFISFFLFIFLLSGSSIVQMLSLLGGFSTFKAVSILGVYVLIFLFYFMPFYYLFTFSNNALAAVREGRLTILGGAFKNLKSYFKFLGILTIVFLLSILLSIASAIYIVATNTSGAGYGY